MPRKLIIGCGDDWDDSRYRASSVAAGGARYHSHEKKMHPAGMHPKNEYDTLDIDPKIKPTYILDINDSENIRTRIESGSYDLIIFERIPATFMCPRICESLDHLLSSNGMVIFIGCAMTLFLPEICVYMQETAFKCYIGSNNTGAGCYGFFKCNSQKATEIFNYYAQQDGYMKKFLASEIMHHPADSPVRFDLTRSIEISNFSDYSGKLKWPNKNTWPISTFGLFGEVEFNPPPSNRQTHDYNRQKSEKNEAGGCRIM